MNLLHLRYFYEVARTRSFTQAARGLRVSQPAISKMVAALESDVGHRLLERGRAMRLTAEGEAVFAQAGRIFAEVRSLEETVSSGLNELRGDWCLGASDNIATYLVPSVIGAFKRAHPLVRVAVFGGTSRQIKDELRMERCQLGIFYTPIKSSEPFQSQKVRDSEFWIVVARENSWFSKSRKKRLNLADLVAARVPRIESRHSDYEGGFPAHFHSHRLGLLDPPWLEVNQHEIKKRLVLEGFGFALLTRHTVEREVAEGSLVRVACGESLAAPIYAVWRKGAELDRVSSLFLEQFRSP